MRKGSLGLLLEGPVDLGIPGDPFPPCQGCFLAIDAKWWCLNLSTGNVEGRVVDCLQKWSPPPLHLPTCFVMWLFSPAHQKVKSVALPLESGLD